MNLVGHWQGKWASAEEEGPQACLPLPPPAAGFPKRGDHGVPGVCGSVGHLKERARLCQHHNKATLQLASSSLRPFPPTQGHHWPLGGDPPWPSHRA